LTYLSLSDVSQLQNHVAPVVADIDNDGMPEIIVVKGVSNKADVDGYYIFKGDGSDFDKTTPDIDGLQLYYSSGGIFAQPAVADLNGDVLSYRGEKKDICVILLDPDCTRSCRNCSLSTHVALPKTCYRTHITHE